MGRQRSEFEQCTTNEDCAGMARHCAIGCGNMIEMIPNLDEDLNFE